MTFPIAPTSKHLLGKVASGLSVTTCCSNLALARAGPRVSRSSFHSGAVTKLSATFPSNKEKKQKILMMDEIVLAKKDYTDMASRYEMIPLSSKTRQDFIHDCASNNKYGGVEGMYRHFKSASTKVTGRFDPELVQALPKNLKFITHNGAGYDQIDIPACTSRQIQVSNVPVAVDDATADTALFLLGSIRQFGLAQTSLRSGNFNAGLKLSHDPRGKVLGIVGMGGIGRAFAKRCMSLGMDVRYHNRNRLSEDLEAGATYVSTMEELVKTSDVVSLNVPLNSATQHLIGRKEFKMMKTSSILINTSRGPIVDEAALVEALEQGEIGGCGLDVYEFEPKIHEGLLKRRKRRWRRSV
ncbi:BQ2448_5043 [Microbotryum intermedium]|uniref:BQ2448_5043 protein n=1 Tax=Microbotryum intermedium TaxID=269621 RepID=A0A238EZY1_9BASI|nr:BQ2448_5043 [Microbotryum intermedium]